MNPPVNENKHSRKSKKRNQGRNKGISSASHKKDKTLNNPTQIMANGVNKHQSRIIKLGSLTEVAGLQVNLELSRDKSLVDKLFLCKSLVAVKMKSFI
jgi:hypothetical protein